ncbi:MAG: EamA family transporter [Bacteroidota bacterium]
MYKQLFIPPTFEYHFYLNPENTMKIKNILMLMALATLWGPSFMLIKIAVAEISPLLLAGFRIAVAALTLLAILWFRRQQLSTNRKFLRNVAIAGLFAHAIPFTLFNWGEMYIDSALASILNGLTPLFTITLAHFFISDEKITLQKSVGTFIGFTGLILLISPNLSAGSSAALMGILAVSLAAFSYAIGIIFSKKFLIGCKPMHAPTAQLLITSVYLLPLGFVLDAPASFTAISWQAAGAVLILGVFGTALAFILYYRILESAGASFLSYSVYIVPVYGVVLGTVFMNERLSVEVIIGAGIILLGLLVANGVLKFRKISKTVEVSKEPALD